ncbi:MAG: ABC transporter substrate-binding protein [Alphaproteobacteria bacterium]|nr:ABC transporter substrate-binding protein [Alphaproteobacteria bacterium]
MMKRRVFLASTAASVTVLAAPAIAQAPDRVTFRFNWSWIGNYSPPILGLQRGYYKDVGIDFRPDQGKGSGVTVRQVGTKADMFAWADTSALLLAAAQGVQVKQVMTMAISTLACVWIDGRTKFETARDIIGKRVCGTAGDGATQLWPAVLAANNIKSTDYEMFNVDSTAGVAALREGRCDVLLGSAADQPVTLQNAGFAARFKTYKDLGVPTLGSGISTHPDLIRENPGLVRRFVQATQRSWQAAIDDPEAAVQALVKHAETPLDARVVRGNLAAFTTLLTGERPMGRTDPAAMEQNIALLKEYTGFKTDLPATHFYTNDFVAPSA